MNKGYIPGKQTDKQKMLQIILNNSMNILFF